MRADQHEKYRPLPLVWSEAISHANEQARRTGIRSRIKSGMDAVKFVDLALDLLAAMLPPLLFLCGIVYIAWDAR